MKPLQTHRQTHYTVTRLWVGLYRFPRADLTSVPRGSGRVWSPRRRLLQRRATRRREAWRRAARSSSLSPRGRTPTPRTSATGRGAPLRSAWLWTPHMSPPRPWWRVQENQNIRKFLHTDTNVPHDHDLEETNHEHKATSVRENLPVLGVVRPHSGAHRGPDNDQQLPQPYRGEHGPVAPLDDSIQPQGQQHGEQQQTRVDQELTATRDGEKCSQLTPKTPF